MNMNMTIMSKYYHYIICITINKLHFCLMFLTYKGYTYMYSVNDCIDHYYCYDVYYDCKSDYNFVIHYVTVIRLCLYYQVLL